MRNKTSETPSHNTVPGGGIFLIKLFFYISGYVSFNIVFVQGLVGDVDRVFLHLLIHIGIFDHGFSLSHYYYFCGFKINKSKIWIFPGF